MRMSRKHSGHASCIVGTVNRRGYGGQQKALFRVSNPKSKSMQNKLISVLSSRSTLGMIETTPQIGEAPDKVRANAILNHKRMYKLELCRAHTPRAHCAIYRVAFVRVHGHNFVIVNFRKLVEVLLNCIYVATGGPGDKKHSLCTR